MFAPQETTVAVQQRPGEGSPRMRRRSRRATAALRVLPIGLAAVTVAACGGTSSSPDAPAQIKHNWMAFFSVSTSLQQKVSLLQNGDRYAAIIRDEAHSSLAEQSSAHVSRVAVHGQSADVTYTITRGSTPVLTGRTGRAVLVHGVWKVSDDTFCSLVSLGRPTPPPCPSAPTAARSSSR